MYELNDGDLPPPPPKSARQVKLGAPGTPGSAARLRPVRLPLSPAGGGSASGEIGLPPRPPIVSPSGPASPAVRPAAFGGFGGAGAGGFISLVRAAAAAASTQPDQPTTVAPAPSEPEAALSSQQQAGPASITVDVPAQPQSSPLSSPGIDAPAAAAPHSFPVSAPAGSLALRGDLPAIHAEALAAAAAGGGGERPSPSPQLSGMLGPSSSRGGSPTQLVGSSGAPPSAGTARRPRTSSVTPRGYLTFTVGRATSQRDLTSGPEGEAGGHAARLRAGTAASGASYDAERPRERSASSLTLGLSAAAAAGEGGASAPFFSGGLAPLGTRWAKLSIGAFPARLHPALRTLDTDRDGAVEAAALLEAASLYALARTAGAKWRCVAAAHGGCTAVVYDRCSFFLTPPHLTPSPLHPRPPHCMHSHPTPHAGAPSPARWACCAPG